MINILRHQGNTNQNDIEIPSHPSQNGDHQQKYNHLIRMEKGEEPLYIVGGNEN
jgi:hypothetical protein